MKWPLRVIVAVVIVAGGIWLYGSVEIGKETIKMVSAQCLTEDEKAIYEVLEEGRPGRVRVKVVDVTTEVVKWSRDFTIPSTNQAKPYELRKCHFYLQQSANYDFGASTPLPGYVWDLRQLNYYSSDSEGRQLVVFSENKTGAPGDRKNHYGTVFTIDSIDKNIALERGQLGNADYALVIKNIETGVDEFTLPLSDVLKDHPNVAGSFDVGAWMTRSDGTYLSTIIYDGSRWMAYIYVKLGTWETEIYETPSDYMAGVERSAPPFAPLLAYTDVIVWAGFDTVTDELLEEQIASGQKKHLIVANLKTGEKTVLEEVPIERDHRFNLKWLSDTELQYTMPDGTIKTYRLQ